MSRVGKAPISLKDAKVSISNGLLVVEGKLGKLSQSIHPLVNANVADETLTFAPADESREANAQQGTMRALAANMVKGVTVGFERKLNLVGVGYRAQLQGAALKLQLGFSHDVIHEMPEGVTAATPTQTEIILKGADKQKVGQVAAEVRAYRPPEPYKGKGVRYSDERVILKETKKK